MNKAEKRTQQIRDYDRLLRLRAAHEKELKKIIKAMKAGVRDTVLQFWIVRRYSWTYADFRRMKVQLRSEIDGVLNQYRRRIIELLYHAYLTVYLTSARNRIGLRDEMRSDKIAKAKKKKEAKKLDVYSSPMSTDADLLNALGDEETFEEYRNSEDENHAFLLPLLLRTRATMLINRVDFITDKYGDDVVAQTGRTTLGELSGELDRIDADASVIADAVEEGAHLGRSAIEGALVGYLAGPWKSAQEMGKRTGNDISDEADAVAEIAEGLPRGTLTFENRTIWQAYQHETLCEYCSAMDGTKEEDANALGAFIPAHPHCYCEWVDEGDYKEGAT